MNFPPQRSGGASKQQRPSPSSAANSYHQQQFHSAAVDDHRRSEDEENWQTAFADFLAKLFGGEMQNEETMRAALIMALAQIAAQQQQQNGQEIGEMAADGQPNNGGVSQNLY